MRAYLFLSVDIIDSTSLKQTDSSWPSILKAFYSSFPKRFNAAIDRLDTSFKKIQSKGHRGFHLEHATVWKLIGDEILLYLEVADYYERVLFTIAAFRNAIIDHNLQKRTYKLKGAIWFANVGSAAASVGIAPTIQGKPLEDFLGTTVDIGFRLSRYSNEEKLFVSAESAILLIRDNHLTLPKLGIRLHFDGTTKLRGFAPNMEEYPLIWIDTVPGAASTRSHPANRSRRGLLTQMRHLSREMQTPCLDTLVDFCQLYIRSSKRWLIYPHVPRDRLFG